MKAKGYECDLHTHTNRSDGQDSPKALIHRAARLGLRVVAITDHDVLPPDTVETEVGPVPIAQYAREKGVLVLPGIEVSCDPQNEDVHIVGLGCDFGHIFFKQLEEQVQQSKLLGYRTLTEKLTQAGYPMAWETVLEDTGNREHPQGIQKKQIFELMAKKGYAASWREAKSLTQTDPRFSVQRWKPDPLEIVRQLHRAGGIAILAHPYLICEPVTYSNKSLARRDYIQMLIEGGLDGIEAAYTYQKTSYRGTLSQQEIEATVRADYGSKVSILSGGSDYHGDYKKGVENPRELGECGISFSYFESHPGLRNLCRQEGAE